MSLESRLAKELIAIQPLRAAAALDRLPPNDAATLLQGVDALEAAAVLAGMSPHAATAVLEALEPRAAACLLAALEQDLAARLARRMDSERKRAVWAALPQRTAHTLETLLHFPEHTAGALMDPEVLALADDLAAEEARECVREAPSRVHYNVYVVDRSGVLVGVVNLRELLLAPPRARLANVMIPDPVYLTSVADRSAVVSHPGWKRVHSIPVVDERGRYLGALRYRTLRQLEDELLGAAETDADTAAALAEVFASGASGVFDALAGPPAKRGRE
jgi:magnesium transporter